MSKEDEGKKGKENKEGRESINLLKKIENETKDWLEKLAKEAQDAAIAFLLAVIMGDAGRKWALTQGGDPEPEKKAFEWGLKIRPVVYKMVMNWFRGLLQGAVADKDFVNKIFSVVKSKK